jgi:hypothetical protein
MDIARLETLDLDVLALVDHRDSWNDGEASGEGTGMESPDSMSTGISYALLLIMQMFNNLGLTNTFNIPTPIMERYHRQNNWCIKRGTRNEERGRRNEDQSEIFWRWPLAVWEGDSRY